ncbi:MAG: hypothetical protein CVU64_12010 [Deltaproteobacteria bacterium HGW-Deltaproteobacteria-21]|nr:MAG: hypothetical protein CVU64_12010 [Deltaproteobacteria bacterium HGW-Deltaproteobacteria-21]
MEGFSGARSISSIFAGVRLRLPCSISLIILVRASLNGVLTPAFPRYNPSNSAYASNENAG